MKKVAIVGAGLSGLLSAFILSRETNIDVTIFEKGQAYSDRLLDKKSNMLHGVGGAGTLSGGKLCFPPASSGVWKKTGFKTSDFMHFAKTHLDGLLDESILETALTFRFSEISKSGIVNKGFESKLLLEHEMRHFVNTLLSALQMQNVCIHTNTSFVKCSKTEKATVVFYSDENTDHHAEVFDYVIIASGRSSAKDISGWLPSNCVAQVSPDLGIRISIGDGENELFSRCGKDIKLKANYGDIGVRTFCVCSGGDNTLVEYENRQYYDGHFGEMLSDIVNFGILVRNRTIVGVENAIDFCNELEHFVGKDISLKDIVAHGSKFLESQSRFSYIFEAIRHFVIRMISDGFISSNLDKYQVFMPSIDRLNPVMMTNKFFETAFENIYVVGDAAGISRGFVQSMWSAYYASENISWKIAVEEYPGTKAI